MRESEEKYRDMFSNLKVMVLLHDLEGNIIQVNDEVLKVFGHSKAELLALNINDLLSEGSPDWTQRIIEPCNNNGTIKQGAIFKKKNQDTFPAYVYSNLLTIDNKKLIQCVVYDISEQRQAEERFELAVESAPNAIVMVDQEGVIKLVNSETEKTFGYTPKELLGQSVEILVPERYRTGHEEHRKQFLTDPQKRQIGVGRDLFAIRKDGREFPAEIALNPVHTKDGLMILCAIVDITDHKRLEERMLVRDRAFMSVTNGILIIDAGLPDNPIIHCNPAFERITGYTRDEIIGRNCRFLHNDDRDQEGMKELRKAIDEGSGCTVLLRNYRKDGTLFWNELTISPVEDESGKLTHFVGVINDVTERKASEQLLKESHAELEQRIRERTAEITEVNEELRREIAERQRAEGVLRAREHQQAMVAELGKKALEGVDLSTLMNETVSLVAETLGVRYCKILELLPDGNELILRAGVGWKEGYVGHVTVGAGIDSQAGFTLLSEEPVIVEDLRREERFSGPPLLTDHGVVSGMSTVIHEREKPFGVLGAHTTKRRIFTKDDINFLQAVANLLAQAIERKNAEYRLQNAFSEIKQLKDRLEKENIYLQKEIDLEYCHGEIIGESKAIKSVLGQAEQVAKTGSTVLLMGETGTGKELLARTIHNLSPRKHRAMVKVNCAVLPPSLVESELFGHEKGAFSGAVSKRIGRFEVADGSTIFLDEIGVLPVELQPKLLRVLQDGEFERVGSSKTLKVDVRVMAATNRNLDKAIEKGAFREDLYYRLNIFPISVPPLCERSEDIPLLVRAFVKELAERIGKRIGEIPKGTIELLKRYHWPGNVRELRSVIERAIILEKSSSLHIELPDLKRSKSRADMSGFDSTMKDIEKEHILNALEMSSWRIRGRGGAAEILGLKPTTLASKMRKLGIVRHQ